MIRENNLYICPYEKLKIYSTSTPFNLQRTLYNMNIASMIMKYNTKLGNTKIKTRNMSAAQKKIASVSL